MINIQLLKKEIVDRLKPLEPAKVILFGSYAWGKPDEDSDIDLYVVTKDNIMPENYRENMNFYLKIAKQLDDIKKKYPCDLIVHTKPMHEKFVRINSSFANEILTKGQTLI